MGKKGILYLLFLLPVFVAAQDDWEDGWGDDTDNTSDASVEIFYDTRVINGHSVETLEKGVLDFRVTHRFGDVATTNAGRTLFGLDNSTDIRIAFEYGILDNLMVGAGRSKGAGPLQEVWDGFVKYKILTQSGEMPVSMALKTATYFTSMPASQSTIAPTYFTKTAHRFNYSTQLIFARKFAERLSLQFAPTYVHRNLVAYGDKNGLFSVGGVAKYRFLKKTSFVVEYFYNLDQRTIQDIEYRNALGIGVEIKTYAHTFQLSFMNSPGLGDAQFIPYTASKWGEGQFRFGFTISRQFDLN